MQTNSDKICKFYLKNNCKKGESCNFSHNVKILKKPKNTLDWTPIQQDATDIKIEYATKENLQNVLKELNFGNIENKYGSVIILKNPLKYAHNYFLNMLNQEINNNQLIVSENLLKLWHGNQKIDGTHYICDDSLNWKSKAPYFNTILEEMHKLFNNNLNIEATRLNIYTNSDEFKPLHHDSAAINPEKAKKQNITIAMSFGQTRQVVLEHAKTKTRISFAQEDNDIYIFDNITNNNWRHGISVGKLEENQKRLSIIIWGKI